MLFRKIAKASSLRQALEEDAELNLRKRLTELLAASGLSISALADRVVASKVHMYQILEGVRKPGRDMLLRIAFALRLSLEETQSLLTVAQRGVLYPRVRRDVAIIYMVEHGYKLSEADEALRALDEQPLLTAPE